MRIYEWGNQGKNRQGTRVWRGYCKIGTARIPSGANPKHTSSDGHMHHQRPGLLESGSVDGEESFGGNAATDHDDVYTAGRVELYHDNVAG